MSATAQREALKAVYAGADWIRKVEAMSTAQVTAIYLRLKAQNKV